MVTENHRDGTLELTEQIAKHFRDVHFGGNWTASNLKDQLAGVTWDQAITKIEPFHTIAALVFHMNYYVAAILKVLRGGPLDAKDKFSFDHPPIKSQADWEALLDTVWNDAEDLANAIEQLSENQLGEIMADEKYGNYYRNLQGIIEHHHYHLGQIALIKRIIRNRSED